MGDAPSPEVQMPDKAAQIGRIAQHWLDKTTVWLKTRWVVLFFAIVLFMIRVYVVQGFFVVTYGLGIYLLNLLINFLSPAVDPELEDGPVLPTKEQGEFRPFTRKLPEFKFWTGAVRAVAAGLVMTFFSLFDLPVFWPILLAYFILLLVLTMKDRIKHMIKHKYIPFSVGKQTYGELTKVKVPGQKGGPAKDSK